MTRAKHTHKKTGETVGNTLPTNSPCIGCEKMSEKMTISKKTDLEYTILCLNVAEDIYNVLGHFKGETAENMANEIEKRLVMVASELNINYFTFARENGYDVRVNNYNFDDISDIIDFKTAIYEVILSFKVFIYGSNWLKAQCEAMAHKEERYGGI